MSALTEDELDLVRASFRDFALAGQEGAQMFYDRLFAIAPPLRRLFPADMQEQCAKLMSMLGAIVAQLHDHAALRPLVGDLARRHVAYGARPEHYAAIGDALLWTLERRLGPVFTAAHAAAWQRAYAALSGTMVEEAAAA
ncbi:globin domain-containing protein [Falsiroseomonas oryzae]|uniref:globin domain-containing protein n=1 Tax=Falsiroseomonas oryzae TaxID=2766473 RepID=UPI0022EB0442|nr:globin domain-containing protein [Roseomonas sp. MO-31]